MMKKIMTLIISGMLLLTQIGVYAETETIAENRSVSAELAFDSTEQIVMEMIIKPQYDDARGFSEGLAPVKVGDKWGFVDENNKMVIKPQYDFVGDFNEGKAVVVEFRENEEEPDDDPSSYNWWKDYSDYYVFGFIDKHNNYTEMHSNDYGEWGTLKISENALDNYCKYNGKDRENWFDPFWMFVQGRLVLPIFESAFDTSGYQVNSPEHEILYQYYNNGKIWALDTDRGTNVLLDKNGNVVKELDAYIDNEDYTAYTYFEPIVECDNGNTLLWIWDYVFCTDEGYFEENGTDWKLERKVIGMLDGNNDILFEVPCENYRYAINSNGGQLFSSGIMIMRNSQELYGGINTNGYSVIDFKYDWLSIAAEGLLCAKEAGGNYYGYIDKSGNWVIPAESEDYAFTMASHFSNGIAAVYDEKTQSAYCISRYSKEKNYKIPGSENISIDAYFPNGMGDGTIHGIGDYAVIKENGKYGFAKFDVNLNLPPEEEVGTEYYEDVCKAIDIGLIPNSLQNQFTEDITKSEFDSIVVNAIEMVTERSIEEFVEIELGKTIDEIVEEYPFEDTSNKNTLALYSLGLLPKQSEDGFYNPYSAITIGEEAYILDSTLEMLSETLDVSLQSELSIDEAFNNMIKLGIISDGDNIDDKSTRAYSFAAIFNMFNYADEKVKIDKKIDYEIIGFEDENGQKYDSFADVPTETVYANIKVTNMSETGFGIYLYSSTYNNEKMVSVDSANTKLEISGEFTAKLKLLKEKNTTNKIFIWENEAIPLTEAIEIN